jgi:hypothetical protein
VPKSSFSDFEFEQITFEIRYDDAYCLWDCAGELWGAVKREIGALSASDKVSPNTQSFTAAGRYGLNVTTAQSGISDHRPTAKETKLPVFMSIVVKHLEIRSLNRIGLRSQYILPVKDMEAGQEFVRSLNLTAMPSTKLFDVNPNLKNPFYQMEVTDDDFGYTVRIGTRKQNVEFSPPPNLYQLKAQSIEQFNVLLDLDLYTMKPVSGDVFEPTSWLEKWMKVTKSDLPKVLELGSG